jgi:putative endonuclease
LVEQRTENPCVRGSIPRDTTKKPLRNQGFFVSVHFVYILYSPSLDKYYVGETEDIELRINQHKSNFYKNSYTSKSDDWILKKTIQVNNKSIALQIEKHIKRKGNKEYKEKVIDDDGLVQYLINKYS